MRRCETCGHTNGRLRQAKNHYTGWLIPGKYVCVSPLACIRRMELEGQWVGKRVLRRIDRDGTEWVIRRRPNHLPERFELTCQYRGMLMTSQHRHIDAAKEHADEMLASFVNPKTDEYRVPEESVDQLELS